MGDPAHWVLFLSHDSWGPACGVPGLGWGVEGIIIISPGQGQAEGSVL